MFAAVFPAPRVAEALFCVQFAVDVTPARTPPANNVTVFDVELPVKWTFGEGMLEALFVPQETPKTCVLEASLIWTASLDPANRNAVPPI
jgi:hypothetical protein